MLYGFPSHESWHPGRAATESPSPTGTGRPGSSHSGCGRPESESLAAAESESGPERNKPELRQQSSSAKTNLAEPHMNLLSLERTRNPSR